MKKKFLSILILIALIVPLFSYYNVVQAYSGEIDPQNYITLPSVINNEGVGTITLSSSASDYSIFYQKVDITQGTMDSIKNKGNELEQYVETVKKEIENKNTNLNELKSKYEQVNSSETATEDEKTTARNNYETALTEYNNYVDNAKQKAETLEKEYDALIPNYTGTWQSTTNSTNNLKIDYSNYAGQGTINYVVWVKIDNGTNTYYKYGVYSTEIEKQESQQPTGGNGTTTGDWTDFSSAKYELKKDGTSDALIEISGVTPKGNTTYSGYISSTADKIDLTKIDSQDEIVILYDTSDAKFKSLNVADVVELNQDLYLNIIENNGAEKEVVAYGIKLDRFEEPKYNNGFFATFMSNDRTQIVTNFTHSNKNNRKMKIKVGKITDTTILNKLKNQDSSGFADLLNYAKSSSAICDEVSEINNISTLEHISGRNSNQKVINLTGIENDAYYYLYVITDDENGKYISNEAVTLAQAYTNDNGWGVFFYGSSDFKWADFGNIPTGTDDGTTAPIDIPKAGIEKIIYIGMGLLIIGAGIVSYKKYKKYQGI